jgi:hypothetical protein
MSDNIPDGVFSIKELHRLRKQESALRETNALVSTYQKLYAQIRDDDSIPNKADKIRELTAEFVSLVSETLDADNVVRGVIEPEVEGKDDFSPEPEPEMELDGDEFDLDEKAEWTTAYINDLPDSAFLWIAKETPEGTPAKKDDEGRTVPRSLRYFPYKDAQGNIDLPHLRNAIQRIPQAKHPELTEALKERLQTKAQRILADETGDKSAGEESGLVPKWLLRLFGRPTSPPTKEQGVVLVSDVQEESSFQLFKDTSGRFRWLGIVSNNIRDREGEILCETAHKEFVRALDAKETEMPELWLWHTPGSVWGKADTVDVANGFLIASGYVLEGCEEIAENLDGMEVKMSHGMPRALLEYDAEDPSIITKYISIEFSVLPAKHAANALTGFSVTKLLEERQMQDEKREFLIEAGMKPEVVDGLVEGTKQLSDLADVLGLDKKELGLEPTDAPEAKPDDKPVSEPEPEPEPEGDAVKDEPVVEGAVTREEIARVIAPIIKSLSAHEAALVQVGAMTGQLETIAKNVGALTTVVSQLQKGTEQQVKDAITGTPPASLEALIQQAVTGPDAADTVVPDDSPLAKDAPAAPQPKEEGPGGLFFTKFPEYGG